MSFQPSSPTSLRVSCNTENQITRFCRALGSPPGWKGGEGLIQSASAAIVAFVSHLSRWKSILQNMYVLLPPVPLHPFGVKDLHPYTVPFNIIQKAVNLTFTKCELVIVTKNEAVKINKHGFNPYEQINMDRHSSLEIFRNSHFFFRPRCAAGVSRLSFWCH